MSNGWNPGQGESLAPPGFEPKAPRPGNYVDQHPTRYDCREDIEDAPGGPPDSDPDHERHIHLTLLDLEDQLVLRPNYTIRKGVERLRRM
jgi:hypothetical protein